jgi:hypothetical protein
VVVPTDPRTVPDGANGGTKPSSIERIRRLETLEQERPADRDAKINNLPIGEEQKFTPADAVATPSGHTPEGGVLVGDADASHQMILFEDPQCPYCRQFEELNGAAIAVARDAGQLVVEYRMRCFLGAESVRADNALALAAEAGRFDELHQALFSEQPPEGSGGFTSEDLLRIGAQVGLTGSDYVAGVRAARYEKWVLQREHAFGTQDPQGTPAAWLDGDQLDSRVLFDTGLLERRLRA